MGARSIHRPSVRNRRTFLKQVGTAGLAAGVPLVSLGCASASTAASAYNGAYGAWLAYMMDVRRVDTQKLAKVAGVSADQINQLIQGQIAASEARQLVTTLGNVMLRGDPQEQMGRVLKALELHADLRNWSGSCDGGCCPWNTLAEISGDPALQVR